MPQNKNPDSSESVLAVAEAAEAAKEAKDADLYFRTDHLKADLGARTARGGIVVLASQALKFVINMATTIVLARLLTPQDYGLIGMVLVVTGFVSLFKNMGL